MLCEALGVSRTGFYTWLRRPETTHRRDDRELAVQIRTIHELSGGLFGSERITRDLRAWGLEVGRRRVARLMREAGLAGRRGRVRRDDAR